MIEDDKFKQLWLLLNWSDTNCSFNFKTRSLRFSTIEIYNCSFSSDSERLFSIFLFVLVQIFLALDAYFNVLTDSSKNWILGITQAIKTVFVFPPRESFKILVNLESL